MLCSASAPVEPCAIGDWSSTLRAGAGALIDGTARQHSARGPRRRPARQVRRGRQCKPYDCRGAETLGDAVLAGPDRRTSGVGVAAHDRRELAHRERAGAADLHHRPRHEQAGERRRRRDQRKLADDARAREQRAAGPRRRAGRGDQEQLADELDPAAVPLEREPARRRSSPRARRSCSCSPGRRTRATCWSPSARPQRAGCGCSTPTSQTRKEVATGVFYGRELRPRRLRPHRLRARRPLRCRPVHDLDDGLEHPPADEHGDQRGPRLGASRYRLCAGHARTRAPRRRGSSCG